MQVQVTQFQGGLTPSYDGTMKDFAQGIKKNIIYSSSLSTGTITPGGLDINNHGNDVVTTGIALGFDFNFYGETFSYVNLCSNGFLQFNSADVQFTPSTLPTQTNYASEPIGSAIFAFWDDLETNGSILNPGIYTQTVGAPGYQIFTAEWRVNYVGAPQTLNFQIRLYEGTNKIEIVYGAMSSIGDTVTIGIQKAYNNAVSFNQYQYSTSVPTAGTMITYTPDEVIEEFDFTPYATTIGLYNDNNELLVVGKLATPYPIPDNTDITFIVRWDS
jgi:hypothetical protein